MAEAGDCKPLLSLLAVPLIERTIAAANQAGLTEFCVVTGHNHGRVETFLSELSLRRNLTITTVANTPSRPPCRKGIFSFPAE